MRKKSSYELHLRKYVNSQRIIGFFSHENGYRGFTMRIFFFRESWEREKKIPRFSLTHSFFENSIVKVSFPGKKKIRHL